MLALTKQPVLEVIMAESIVPTVKPCVKCGAIDRDKRGVCNPCQKLRAAEYYKRNAQRIADAQRERIAKDPVRRKAITDKWRSKSKEAIKVTQAKYNKKHKARLDAARKLWLEKNQDKVIAGRKRRGANKQARDAHNHNRRARRQACGGKLSTHIGKMLFALQRGKCACCGLPLGNKYHLDHIMPLALGGTNTDDNVQLLRAKCNLEKSKKHPVDFMQQRGFLL